MNPQAAPGWDCHVHVFDAAAPVVAGHYRPVHRPLEQIEALAAAHGFGHLVLVQPSVYGTDNSVMLQALRASHGRHRGVAVVDAAIEAHILDAMHEAGVRGVRFNLMSPVGHHGVEQAVADFARLAPQLRERGWHAQWYAAPAQLQTIAGAHEGTGIRCVLDHLSGMHAEISAGDDAWRHVETLAAAGVWIKLSGWYRLRAVPPYHALHANLRRVADLFAGRMLWGSDWPHTSFSPDALPAYASLLRPLEQALSAEEIDTARRVAPALLYR